MCGIVGIINLDAQKPVAIQLLKKMIDVIHYRGPDDEGFHVEGNVGLGVCRLSIIDLETGHQPIHNEDKTIWVVQNGEIYNFRELRSNLERFGHRFCTNSDTEVIVHCYEEYGDHCPEYLRGMFAFAIWDSKSKKLLLARDRVGIKPLFYLNDDQTLLFGSEIKSILCEPTFERQLSIPSLDEYLTYGYIPEPNTIFQGIKKLPPGHVLICGNGNIYIKKYWDVIYPQKSVKDQTYYEEKVKEILKDSLKFHLISDVPVGILLSGGIDSSTVTGLTTTISNHRVKTFSVKGGGGVFNELPYARLVADKYDTEHYEFEIEPNLVEIIPKLISYFDEPFADSSALPTYYVSKIASRYVKVVLSGEGGDELFSGYPWHIRNIQISNYRRIPAFIRKNIVKKLLLDLHASLKSPKLIKLLNSLKNLNDYSLLTEADTYQALMTFASEDLKNTILTECVKEQLKEQKRPDVVSNYFMNCDANNILDRSLYCDLKTYLPGDLLTKVDRMSMANSLEVRVPFLDHQLIEFMATVPPELKLRGKVTKYILKKSMRDILPEKIQRRGKRGFSIPVARWFREDLSDYVKDILMDNRTKQRGIFSSKGIESIIRRHQNGEWDYGSALWSLIIFELWARMYLD